MSAYRDRRCCRRRRCGGRRGLAVAFRPGPAVLSGAPFTGRGRTHLIVMTLIAGLVAASCGSDDRSDASPTGSAPDTPAVTFVVPPDPEGPPEGPPEDPPEPDAPWETAQPDSVAEPVRLGSRFTWCAEIRDVWDAHTAAFAREAEAANVLAAAVDAQDTATDELDKAEAANVLEGARESYRNARASADAHANAAIEPLLRSVAREGDEPEDIAYRRAWEAFASEASSEEVALMQLPDDLWVRYSVPPAGEPWASPLALALDPDQTESELAEYLNEAAAAASAAAAEFSAQAVSYSDEAIAAQVAFRDALVAARDAEAVSGAASAAVAAAQLVQDIAAAVEASVLATAEAAEAAYQTDDIIRVAEVAGLAAVDSGLRDNATASLSAAEAGLARIRDEISDDSSVNRDLDEAKSAAYRVVLLHSAAHLAFARSLGESCQ